MPEFTKAQRIILVAGIGAALVALAVAAMVRGCGAEPSLVVSATAATPSPADGPPTVTVHVKGAVLRQGLYQLRRGARVADAVAAAGGVTQQADTQQLNLAAFLTDGQQVNVPQRFTPPPAANVSRPEPRPWSPPTSSPRAAEGPSASVRLDINRATAEQLTALPGIGPVLAERIVLNRQHNGPFHGLDDLARVEGVGPKRVEALRPYVTF